ncbi:transposase [Picosynechococcus sp. NKBG042902]|uniref:transposase n=1 Tax=Picosynechococcus sp. NKBG042902 TaxID=490193 RepID=UPI0004AA9CE5|nr:transposase [Picosynechococcus sp. NKBG042902]
MAKSADIGSKRLISLNPDAWVQWVMGDQTLQAQELIDPQFQWVSRDSDVLLRVTCPQDGDFLLLNELQLRYTAQMPRRMTVYAALAREKFNLPVYPVLINILPPASKPQIPTSYQAVFKGLQTRQDYQVINLWEVEANLVLAQSLTSLLPFVPILAGGNDESLIREAVHQLRQEERLDELEPLLAFFASFVLDLPLVQQIMRWDMTVLRESPWYNEILSRGQRRGQREKEISVVLRLLQRNFSVEEIAEIVDDSVEAVTKIIQDHQGRSPQEGTQD